MRSRTSSEGERWLFVLHVDWRWIKQRPHWLAEEASRTGDVLVAYRPHPGRAGLPTNSSDVRRFPLLPLPLGRWMRHRRLMRLVAMLNRAWVRTRVRSLRPTHVYISHPKLYAMIPRSIARNAKLFYDCMDDAVAMGSPEAKATLRDEEGQLVDAAQCVVVSSRSLALRLSERWGRAAKEKLVVVENGLPGASLRRPIHRLPGTSAHVTVGYAGTVARWFDFENVTAALNACPDVYLRIVGPRSGNEPRHAQIEYLAPVDHDRLPAILGCCDALIMPFRVDEIVTAVNPVKLYEYLTYGVPVISCRYQEVDAHFGRFVDAYVTADDLARLFGDLARGNLRPKAEWSDLQKFLTDARWDRRWAQIRRAELVEAA